MAELREDSKQHKTPQLIRIKDQWQEDHLLKRVILITSVKSTIWGTEVCLRTYSHKLEVNMEMMMLSVVITKVWANMVAFPIWEAQKWMHKNQQQVAVDDSKYLHVKA